MGYDKQMWLTYASTDEEGIKSLVLLSSLKYSITRRRVGIFVGEGVSRKIRKKLETAFDKCISVYNEDLDEGHKDKPFNEIAKSLCWNVGEIERFTFLDCNCLVLRNADKLFETAGNSIVETLNGKKVCYVETGFIATEDLTGDSVYGGCVKCFAPIDLLNYVSFPLTGECVLISGFINKHPVEFGSEEIEPILQTTCQLKNANGRKFLHKNQKLETALSGYERNNILKDSIAIVGISLRFPGANNIDEFWDMLVHGKDGISKAPSDRWNANQCYIKQDNVRETLAGFLKCPIDEIDAKLFGINPAEVPLIDPQQRLALHIVYESLENANIDPLALERKQVGVFGGWWRQDYKEILQEHGLDEEQFFRAYMGNALGTFTSRISHALNITGPSIPTESGCSTAIVGVDMACKHLQNEDCDIAIAVGANLLVHPYFVSDSNVFLCADGKCKTFDAKADGFVRAEGCASLILKRYSDAVAQNDKIWGVIRGSAVVQEGPSRSMGTPTTECEALAMKLALKRANVHPKYVSYVETHGTGTSVGDPIEVAAVAEAYSPGRKNPLTIGSVKTNIGHTESVCGIAGIIKTILSLKHEIIPPHLHFETLNPNINLDSIPAQIPVNPISWPKNVNGQQRIAGVSSFGITGTDAHMIIQEIPADLKQFQIIETRPLQLLTISAKTPEALSDYVLIYKTYLQTTTDKLKNIALTTNLGRAHYGHRLTVHGKSTQEILLKLNNNSFEVIQCVKPFKICFVFTGQGSQYFSMGKDLYEHSVVFKSHFDYCCETLNRKYAVDIKTPMWANDDSTINETLFSQTSIFCIEHCLVKLWESWGVKPDAVLGHSLGEFAAAVSAGILIFEEALELVVIRSKLINKLQTGQMVVVKADLKIVQDALKSTFEGSENSLDIAAVNSVDQTVLSGSPSFVSQFIEFCKKVGIKTHILRSKHAFHSKHMDKMIGEFKETTDKITLNNVSEKCIYISGMEGKIMKPTEINSSYWIRHTREKVNFLEASRVALNEDISFFLEVGPHPILNALVQQNLEDFEIDKEITFLASLRQREENWETVTTSLSKLYLSGCHIDFKGYHRYTGGEKINIPLYPFQTKPYWIDCSDGSSVLCNPIIGKPIINPSEMVIYKNELDLRQLGFLKDHAMGGRIIFPGAGFMEICLTSGALLLSDNKQTNQDPNDCCTVVSDFKIDAPLCLNEENKTEIQIILPPCQSIEQEVVIYSKLTFDDLSYKWIRHASGRVNQGDSKALRFQNCEILSLEMLRIRCPETVKTDIWYKNAAKSGAVFGPYFQTITEFWKGEHEYCFKIVVSKEYGKHIRRILLIDSMFQSLGILFNFNADTPLLPVSVDEIFCSDSFMKSDTFYMYTRKSSAATTSTNLNQEIKAVLMDSTCCPIVTMIGPDFLDTTIENLLAIIDAQRNPYPSMYKDVWKDLLGPFERRIGNLNDVTTNRSLLCPLIEAEDSKLYNSLDIKDEFYFDQMNRLNSLYMANTLYKLGLKRNRDQLLSMKHLIEEWKVQKSLQKFLRYILVELSSEKWLVITSESTAEDVDFYLTTLFPTERAIAEEIEKNTF